MRWIDPRDLPVSELLQIVVDDLAEGLADVISPPDPEDPWSAVVFPDDAVTADLPTSSSFVAVPWMWVGLHTGKVDDLPEESLGRDFPVRDPTGRPVAVEGLTLLQRTEGDEVAFHRFVDWLSMYGQLGVLMAGRTPFSERPTA